jgi:hypothetical protein
VVDLLFDGLDQLMDRVRRSYPVALVVLGLAVWSVVAGLGSYLFGTESLVFGAAMSAGPLLLVALAAVVGVGRIPWPVWPLGVSPLVLIGGLFAPQAADWVAEEGYAWVVAVLVFSYVQVFLGTLQAVDELRQSRAGRAGRTDRPAATMTARRRVLQLKVLISTQLVAIGTGLGDPLSNGDRTTVGGPAPLIQVGIMCVLLLGFLAVFLRGRKLATAVSVGLLTLCGLYLAAINPADRWTMISQHGWLVLATGYLWFKAGTKDYWPRRRPAPPPDPGGYAGYYPWQPGYPDYPSTGYPGPTATPQPW